MLRRAPNGRFCGGLVTSSLLVFTLKNHGVTCLSECAYKIDRFFLPDKGMESQCKNLAWVRGRLQRRVVRNLLRKLHRQAQVFPGLGFVLRAAQKHGGVIGDHGFNAVNWV